MFEDYLEKYGYPFRLYNEKGEQIDFILTEREHKDFIKNFKIMEEIILRG